MAAEKQTFLIGVWHILWPEKADFSNRAGVYMRENFS